MKQILQLPHWKWSRVKTHNRKWKYKSLPRFNTLPLSPFLTMEQSKQNQSLKPREQLSAEEKANYPKSWLAFRFPMFFLIANSKNKKLFLLYVPYFIFVWILIYAIKPEWEGILLAFWKALQTLIWSYLFVFQIIMVLGFLVSWSRTASGLTISQNVFLRSAIWILVYLLFLRIRIYRNSDKILYESQAKKNH